METRSSRPRKLLREEYFHYCEPLYFSAFFDQRASSGPPSGPQRSPGGGRQQRRTGYPPASWASTGIIRTIARPPTSLHARAIAPARRPYPAPSALGAGLGGAISAVRVARHVRPGAG